VTTASEDWLVDRPAETVTSGDLTLTRTSEGDVADMVVAINESLDHLRPWMAWAQTPATSESMGLFAGQADSAWRSGREFFSVVRRGQSGVVGGTGLHARQGPGVLEIGYWVHVDHVGQGVASAAAAALTEAAFALPRVERVEIHCVASNLRSAAVPRRLGYHRVESGAPAEPALMVWTIDRDEFEASLAGRR
jgi:RimJ/RimL family protein N-acetyltransferase